MSDDFLAPPAFKPAEAFNQLKRSLRDLRPLVERGNGFELQGMRVIELAHDETTITAKLAQRVTDDSLTDREREVLTLVAEGRSNREIGSEIHIEESTVKTHLKSIFAKLHAESRTEAVMVATRRGLLRQSGSF